MGVGVRKRKKAVGPGRGPDPGGKKDRGPVLYLRLTPGHEAALQQLIRRQRIRPDRTAVGLAALEDLFAREGLWPPKPKP